MENTLYASLMSRRTTRQRPRQGAHLAQLRQAAGLTQAELAAALDVSQQIVAFWEFSTRPPRSDLLPKLAHTLGVSVETLLTPSGTPHRRSGPWGKAQRAFEAVSALPRSQQEKIVELVDALVQQYRRKAG